MSLCSIGMVSKMFIESIEDLDKRILESLDAAGCTTFQKIRYGIVPQLTADFSSTIIYRFDMNLRDATVLGLVIACNECLGEDSAEAAKPMLRTYVPRPDQLIHRYYPVWLENRSRANSL